MLVEYVCDASTSSLEVQVAFSISLFRVVLVCGTHDVVAPWLVVVVAQGAQTSTDTHLAVVALHLTAVTLALSFHP